MAEGCAFDLNYITERIIAVSFDQTCPEQIYLHHLHSITQMLQSKHSNNYLVINLSEPREELRRMNARVLDVGWSEQHAPSLHLLCSLCKNIENWLSAHTEHVLLLHCKGGKDRVGLVISSYTSLPHVSNSEEQALNCYTMKRFYSQKMSSLMTPSQTRYVQMFGKLLSRQLKINSSPLLFHCIYLNHIPNLHPTGAPMSAIKPLQLIQNAAARLVFNQPKHYHITPLLRSLHWLPVAARIQFKTLMLAYKAKNGPAPDYLKGLIKARSIPCNLRATSLARLDPPSRTRGRPA